jgi:hypothetical protein
MVHQEGFASMAEETTPLIVAVFDSMQQATRAYNELRAAGFGDDYLGLADPQRSKTGLGDTLKNAGVPENENEFYKREFDAGHPIVTFRTGGVPQESIEKAIAILRNFGAYDALSQGKNGEGFAANARRNAKTPFFDIAANRGENEPR